MEKSLCNDVFQVMLLRQVIALVFLIDNLQLRFPTLICLFLPMSLRFLMEVRACQIRLCLCSAHNFVIFTYGFSFEFHLKFSRRLQKF